LSLSNCLVVAYFLKNFLRAKQLNYLFKKKTCNLRVACLYKIYITIYIGAYCDVVKLNVSIGQIGADSDKINNLTLSVASAKSIMRDILDCNPDLSGGHNDWLWAIFDTLCEYDAFLPHIYEDLNIKKGMLEAERDRCAGRSKFSFAYLTLSRRLSEISFPHDQYI